MVGDNFIALFSLSHYLLFIIFYFKCKVHYGQCFFMVGVKHSDLY